jgi:hypothetical protein
VQKIIWIDDVSESINYERNTLIPQRINTKNLEIHFYEQITELMEFLFENKINDDDIFIVDIMLMDEKNILLPNEEIIEIPDELMAGTILYSEYLKERYPNNPVILYTSREHEGRVFKNIKRDSRYEESLFLIDKWEKDTKFIEALNKLVKD